MIICVMVQIIRIFMVVRLLNLSPLVITIEIIAV